MAQNVSEFVIGRLREWGTTRVFGYPGDGIGAFDAALGALDAQGEGLDYIRPTHEEIAAFMATAHAKFTGEVGVCVATSSPGAFHLINGLYDAQMDNTPVVAIVGQQGLAALGTATQQESNLERVFADVAVYVATSVSPEQAQAVVDTAFRTAWTRLGPAVIVLPHDVQALPAAEPGAEHWVSRSSAVPASARILPDRAQLEAAAAVINAGSQVTLLVGAGARGAIDAVVELANKTGAGIITALRGKDVVPADVPFHTQQLGLLGSMPSLWQMHKCDTLLMLGTNYPYGEFLPPTGHARAVQVDLKPEQLGLRYPTEVNLWGDVGATLEALLPLIERKPDRSWQEAIADHFADWEREMRAEALVSFPDGANPRRVFYELNERLPDDAIVTADAGTTADWYAHHIRLRRGMRGDLSGRLASMLASMPYALAAKFAYPERPVVCTIGDGAFQMLGMNELITIRKYAERWPDKRFVVAVMHNDDLAQVSWEARTEDAAPVWRASQDVESIDYAGYAELLGFRGIRIRSDDEIASAWDAALAFDGVTVLDCYVTRNAPPLPPKITKEYRENTLKALAHDDPLRVGAVVDSAEALGAAALQRAKNVLHLGDRGEGQRR